MTYLFNTIPVTQKGAANGVASLDSSGDVPSNQLDNAPVSTHATTHDSTGSDAITPAGIGAAELDGNGKLVESQNTGLVYKGTWNGFSNSPTLSSGTGQKGNYYIVSTSGAALLDGIDVWTEGDWVMFNGTAWTKLAPTNSSIIQTGSMLLNSEQINRNSYKLDWVSSYLVGSISPITDPFGIYELGGSILLALGNSASSSYYMYSLNFGKTWSAPILLETSALIVGAVFLNSILFVGTSNSTKYQWSSSVTPSSSSAYDPSYKLIGKSDIKSSTEQALLVKNSSLYSTTNFTSFSLIGSMDGTATAKIGGNQVSNPGFFRIGGIPDTGPAFIAGGKTVTLNGDSIQSVSGYCGIELNKLELLHAKVGGFGYFFISTNGWETAIRSVGIETDDVDFNTIKLLSNNLCAVSSPTSVSIIDIPSLIEIHSFTLPPTPDCLHYNPFSRSLLEFRSNGIYMVTETLYRRRPMFSEDSIVVAESHTFSPHTNNYVFYGDTTSTVYLPSTFLSEISGIRYTFKKTTGTGTFVINGSGTQIDGNSSVSISTNYESVCIVYTGTEWIIV